MGENSTPSPHAHDLAAARPGVEPHAHDLAAARPGAEREAGWSRVIRLMFRRKGARGTLKVFTNLRLPGRRRSPVQLHLGYISLRGLLSAGARGKIERRLQDHWSRIFATPVKIDWIDAERKLTVLASMEIQDRPVVDTSKPVPIDGIHRSRPNR